MEGIHTKEFFSSHFQSRFDQRVVSFLELLNKASRSAAQTLIFDPSTLPKERNRNRLCHSGDGDGAADEEEGNDDE